MKEQNFGLTSLSHEEMTSVNGGGWWEDFKAAMQKDLADAAAGIRDAIKQYG